MQLLSRLPDSRSIKRIEIYDFDNTLFKTPLPNKTLWSPDFIKNWLMPADSLLPRGGWWHQPDILEAVGRGLNMEEKSGFQGFWNEELIHRMEDGEDAVRIILTGRSGPYFYPVLRTIIESRGLNSHILALKPSDGIYEPLKSIVEGKQKKNGLLCKEINPFTTLNYKFMVIDDLVSCFSNATSLIIWEDRKPHADAFRNFVSKYIMNGRLEDAVVEDVIIEEKSLDISRELDVVHSLVAKHNQEVKRLSMMNHIAHSQAISLKKRVQYTAFFIHPKASRKLIKKFGPKSDLKLWKISADHCTIVPHHCPREMLRKVGDIGSIVPLRAIAWAMTDTCIAVKVEHDPEPINNPHLQDTYRSTDDRYIWVGSHHDHSKSYSMGTLISRNSIPHITIAHCPSRGGKPYDANLIPQCEWEPIFPPMRLGNAICGEKYLWGSGNEERFVRVPPPAKPISIGKMIRSIHVHLTGPAIGRACRWVETQMIHLNIENAHGNEDAIAKLVKRYNPARQGDGKGSLRGPRVKGRT